MDSRHVARWLRETDRPPLPAGDPVSWSVLTEGTVLEGIGWPSWADSARRETQR